MGETGEVATGASEVADAAEEEEAGCEFSICTAACMTAPGLSGSSESCACAPSVIPSAANRASELDSMRKVSYLTTFTPA